MDCGERQHYHKSAGFANLSGQLYKVKLAMLLFLRGINQTQGFHLASNMKSAGMFDDIVFKCMYKNDESGEVTSKVWFVKLKHKQTTKITQASLMSLRGDFSLPKYCNSFHNMETYCKEDRDLSFLGASDNYEFVIHTNAMMADELVRQWTPHSYRPDNILNSVDNKGLVFSFCEDTYGDMFRAFEDLLLYKKFLDELRPLLDNSDVMKEEIDDFVKSIETKIIANKLNGLKIKPNKTELDRLVGEMREVEDHSAYKVFLPKVHFFTGQSSEDDLDKLIKMEIQETCHVSDIGARSVYIELQDAITMWWKSHNYYLTENADIWRTIRSKIPQASVISEPHLNDINKLGIMFFTYPVTEVRNLILKTKVSNVIVGGAELALSCLKVYQAVESLFSQRYIFISLKSLISQRTEVLLLWPSMWYPVLVVVCEEPMCDGADSLCNELSEVLSKQEAKIVLISAEGDAFAQCFKYTMNNSYSEMLDKSKLINLDDQSQLHILEKKVMFQGYMVPLGSLVNSYSELKEHLNAPILSKLLKETYTFVIGPDLCTPIENYISRSLECFIPINKNILKASSLCGVFAISNTTIGELTRLVLPQEDISLFDSLIHGVDSECRLFILSLSSTIEVFDMLCNHFPKKSVHHFMLDGDILIWKETRGDPGRLRDYICKEKITADPEHVAEYMVSSLKSSHCPLSVLDVGDDLVVITAKPGMGKSTLLTTLAQQTKLKDPNSWVIYLNLNDHRQFLSETAIEDLDRSKVLELLYASLEDGEHFITHFERVLLRHSLQNKGNVIILIDGFNEISPLYAEKALTLITILRHTNVKKLWVTSQPGMHCKILKSLNAVAYALQPFTQSCQRNFLIDLWVHKFPSIDKEVLDNFIIKLQESVQMCLNDKCSPLQSMMLAETFEENLIKFISEGNVDLPEKITVLQLYDRFIDKKLEIYYQGKKELDVTESGAECNIEELAEEFRTNHMLCALLVLFEDTELSELHMQDTAETVSEFIKSVAEGHELTALIHEIVNGTPRFIHHTFAEYFAGMWFSRNFHTCREFLLHRIFDPSFAIIMNVFDWYLVREHDLHLAVLNNDRHTVSYLLKLGVDVNDTDDGGRTPLHLAVVHSKPLTSAQPNTNVEERDAYNPITKLLVDHAANVKMVDDILHWRPIQYATSLKIWDALDLVLKDQVDMNELSHMKEKLADKQFLQEGLLMACEKGYFNLIECFSSCGIDLSTNMIEHREGLYNPLHLAARYGQLKLVRCLLSKKVKLSSTDKKGNTPLHFAVREGMLEIVLYLVQRGADIDARDKEGNTPLNQVVCKGDLQTVFFLVEHLGCNISLENKYGDTPLHRAAGSGYLTLVEYLLSRGADIDAVNREGNTCLHRVTWMGNLPIVQALLANGADVNVRNNNGDTPLSQSAGGGRLVIIQCLVESGADVTEKAEDGNTALHWAARQNNVKVLTYLLDKGADINACNRYGNTALHKAVEHGSFEAAEYLRERGSDPTISNNAGYTVDTIRVRKV